MVRLATAANGSALSVNAFRLLTRRHLQTHPSKHSNQPESAQQLGARTGSPAAPPVLPKRSDQVVQTNRSLTKPQPGGLSAHRQGLSAHTQRWHRARPARHHVIPMGIVHQHLARCWCCWPTAVLLSVAAVLPRSCCCSVVVEAPGGVFVELLLQLSAHISHLDLWRHHLCSQEQPRTACRVSLGGRQQQQVCR